MRQCRVWLLSRFKVPFVVVFNDLDGRLAHFLRLAGGERKRSVGGLRGAVGNSEENELPDHRRRFWAKRDVFESALDAGEPRIQSPNRRKFKD